MRQKKCYFCGGTHAQVWRDRAIPKLRHIWSTLPYDDVDCRITHLGGKSLKSYCIQIGLGDLININSEETSIPKNRGEGENT